MAIATILPEICTRVSDSFESSMVILTVKKYDKSLQSSKTLQDIKVSSKNKNITDCFDHRSYIQVFSSCYRYNLSSTGKIDGLNPDKESLNK